ncbi:hypothetical protein S7711_09134 [Stachybotrys chartarum IBT 7711]|uniref:Uncharacterized protein n=1 Tax=Stachybotrys chartarum (strain CBS 109288 / IBT 7711) TaxID=1280523 RepID=A0A084B7R9_STACB|nr:hypothetical protein S7711_09134 [Stachybotrys chartarum IBT 7711]KFA55618.1 hypothetical protein S40293_09676 [Stachybotrys chartarum IBT 40293]
MPATVFSPGSTALITGAASGVGLAIAKLCKAKGMNLVLADRNEAALKALDDELGIDSSVVKAESDVSKLDDWERLKEIAENKYGGVELVVLNAGMSAKGGWEDHDYFRTTLETNLFGVIHGINTFLPLVKEASATKPTAFVITGSKQGITNPPGNPAYNASKAAVKSLAEQLSYDLKDTNTSVHLLVPGWTFTGLTGASSAAQKPDGAWAPEQVASYMYDKMTEGRFYIICPDNDVTENTDKKRMLWSVGDIVHGRPPLSRWREEWKGEAAETMKKMQL